ncbi:MAG: TonB-dependent receptor [Bacteroidales bacterium]|nr:TonB-dependent receptor [Bacteroidales bacterium]
MKQDLIFHLPCKTHGWLRKTAKVLQLAVFLCILTSMNLAAVESYPQNARLSLDLKSVTIEQVLQKIEQSSEFFFLYNSRLVDVTRKVDVNYKEEKILDILEDLFSSDNVEYIIKDRQIILSPKNYDKLFAKSSKVQGITITGTVTDVNGNSLPGVNVVEKGTINGAVTDLDGNYTITVAGAEATLVFSFVGYLTEEMAVGSSTVLNVTLIEDILKLDEVVVVGYGTVKKSDVTGSLTSITAETLQERPVQNAIQAMQGKAAGVDIVSNVRPGNIANVRIRGNKSLTATEAQKAPLYVVDGIILMGDLNDINPNDIASMEILKDASATAIYGSRGANGVILITTKKGTKGKVSVNYDGYLSFDRASSVTEWATAGEALDRKRLAYINTGSFSYAYPYPNPAEDITRFGGTDYWTIDAIRKGYEWEDPGTYSTPVMRETTQAERDQGWPDQVPVYNSGNIPTTDWIDLLTQTSATQNHVLSLSSGTENANVYFSVGYLDNKGIQLNQGYKRFTSMINGDVTPAKWLKIGTSVNLSRAEQQYGTMNRAGSATGAKDLYGLALGQYLMAQPYDTNGILIEYPGGNNASPVWNPLIDIDNSEDQRIITNIQSNLFSEFAFTSWLKYRINFGAGLRNVRKGTWQGRESTLRRQAAPRTAYATYDTDEYFQYMVENILYFDKTYGIHTFGATLMQSAQRWQHELSRLAADKIINDAPKWYDLASNLEGKASSYSTGFEERALVSFMGRINYSLMNRYLLTASMRYDGASVLATGHKWAAFPSLALAWKIQEEEFLKSLNWISELKLRLGYGVVGNYSVNPYVSTGPLRQYNYVFNNTVAVGYIPSEMPNPLLGWETTAQYNLGLDFSFLRNRILGNFDIYQSDTYDLLMTQTLPAIIGYPNIINNIGKMKNTGVEFSLTTVNVRTRDFSWETSLNWSTNKEEIIELVNGKEDMKGAGGLNNVGWFIGQPANVFRHYEVAGLWQDTPEDLEEIALWQANGHYFAPGQLKPVDQNGDYKLTDEDKVIRGSLNPKWIGGITNTFSYKGFELSSFIYARIGQKYYANLHPGGTGSDRYIGYTRHADIDEFWSPDNPGGKYTEITTVTSFSNADLTRANFINDGSFVVVRNIGLSYNLPQAILSRVSVKNLQVYAQVLNPFLFGGDVVKAGYNPDDLNDWNNVNSIGDPVGGANNNTMIIKSWVLGIKVGL